MEAPIRVYFELGRSSKNSQNLKTGNEMINANDRLHFHVKAELTKHLRELANGEARHYIGDLPKGSFLYSKEHPCFILVYVYPPTRQRMDAPNWYPTVKALIDGLTDMGMFEDDNDSVITSFTFLNGGKARNGNKKYELILEIHPGRIEESLMGGIQKGD